MGFFNGFELLLGITNSSMYFGNISLPDFFDNFIFFCCCGGGGGCDSFGIRKLKVWVSISLEPKLCVLPFQV